MTNETKHAPTPWDTMGGLVIRVEGPTTSIVAKASSEEDAAHIVKCVNMHDELVSVLDDIRDFLKRSGYDTKIVRDALAKARGEA